MFSAIPLEFVIIAIIFIVILAKVLWDKRGSPEERQFRSDVAQLKRVEKEVNRLRSEMFD